MGTLTSLRGNKAPDKPVKSETIAASKVSKVPSTLASVLTSHLAGREPLRRMRIKINHKQFYSFIKVPYKPEGQTDKKTGEEGVA